MVIKAKRWLSFSKEQRLLIIYIMVRGGTMKF
jgi:hypothetical protein